MKYVLIICVLATGLYGQIAYKRYVGCPPSGNTTCTATLQLDLGDTVMLFENPTASVPVVSDTCGNKYTWLNQTGTGLPQSLNLVYLKNALPGTCAITVNIGYSTAFNWAAVSYSGVQGIGQIINTSNLIADALCGVGATTQDPSNFWVVGMSVPANYVMAVTRGTLRGTTTQSTPNARTIGVVDSSASLAGVTVYGEVNKSTTSVCNSTGVELRSLNITQTNTPAKITDQTRLTFLQGTPARPYALPARMLSPVWCTNVFSNSTQSVPTELPSRLNGSGTPMGLPAWATSRVCQDRSFNYWANPPFNAGTGVTMTRNPNNITLSLSARSGSGQIELGGGYLRAGRCSSPVTIDSPGVNGKDTVHDSLATNPDAIPNLAYLSVRVLLVRDKVEFRVCNRGMKTLNVHQFTMNWYAEP